MRRSLVLAFATVVTVLAMISACDQQPAVPPSDRPAETSAGAATGLGAQPQVKPYPLDVCIVSGEALGSMGQSLSLVYEGQEYKFCCADCPAAFKKDPQKYVAKLQSQLAAKAPSAGQPQAPAPMPSP